MRHERRLRDLRDQTGSLEEAILMLHTAAGIGALNLAKLVASVSDLTIVEAKRLVVRVIAPYRDELRSEVETH
jgi:hypothetical protein